MDIIKISTHAPLAGCDQTPFSAVSRAIKNFNPRTPCGVRQIFNTQSNTNQEFQPTHPLRGATFRAAGEIRHQKNFNPRTPCGVRRMTASLPTRSSRYFNARTPCGVRLTDADLRLDDLKFQPTHPLRGATFDGVSMR